MLCSSIQTCHSVTALFPHKRQPSNSLAIEGTTAQLDDLYMSYAVESSWLGYREDLFEAWQLASYSASTLYIRTP